MIIDEQYFPTNEEIENLIDKYFSLRAGKEITQKDAMRAGAHMVREMILRKIRE